jgi:hypothetical protein
MTETRSSVAERSRARRRTEFSRGRLVVGLLLLCVLAGGAAYGLGRLRASPDPGRVLFATRGALYGHDLASGEERRVTDLPNDIEAAIASPDGKWVAYARGAGEVWVKALEGEEHFRVAEQHTALLGWAPDSRLIASELLSDGDLVAVDPAGGRTVLMTGGYIQGSVPVWLDANRFAIATSDDEFTIVEDGERIAEHDGRVLAASPDGRELLWQDGKSVYVGDIQGESSAIFKGTAERTATSPGGYVAISTENGIYVFEGGTKSRRVTKKRTEWLGWARTGPIVVYAANDAVYALDLRGEGPSRISGREKKVLPLFSFEVV